MTFTIGRPSTLGCPDARRIEWIYEIHVHRDVETGGIQRRDLYSFVHDVGHPALIQFAHREYANAERFQELALARIDAASADDGGVFRKKLRREPSNVS